jgi:hypothetical protein
MNSRLEQYVEEVASGLSSLPEHLRQEEVTELRQHLDATVESYLHGGLSEAEAAEKAIRQFGDARTVRRDLLRSWHRRKSACQLDTLPGALLVALGTSFAAERLQLPSLFEALLRHVPWEWLSDQPESVAAGARVTLFLLMFTVAWVLPAAAVGALVGRLAPRHAIVATIAALLLPFGCAVFSVALGDGTYDGVSLAAPAFTLSGGGIDIARLPLLFTVPVLLAGVYAAKRGPALRRA